MHQNLPLFMDKTAKKKAAFWSKFEFVGLRKAIEDPPTILGVLDAKKQVVGIHGSRKHTLYSMRMHQNLQFFMKKTGKNGPFLVKF